MHAGCCETFELNRRAYVVKNRCYQWPKVVDILVTFCNFVFLCKQKTEKLLAFEVRYVCKKAL